MITDRPLRFCLITTFYPPYNFGGDGIFTHRLANELARHGHHVTVIHSIDAFRLQARGRATPKYEDHPNVTVHGLVSPSSLLTSLVTQQTGVPVVYSARIQRILQQGFDVINTVNASLVSGAAGLTYGQGIKLYTILEYWLVCQTHVLFRCNREACTRPTCLRCSLVYRRPPQWWRYGGLLQSAIKHVDAFIAPSRFCQDAHRQRGFDAPMVHLPCFVPPADLAPPNQSAAPYFLFAGRLAKLKGLQTIIPIFRDYSKAKLMVAGAGDYEGHLRRLAQGSDNIQFLGRVTGAELRALYRNAVALVVPSLCYEAFPMVVPEAFQQQTPVIARNLGAMPEMVGDSGGGLAYDSDAELTAGLDRLVDNPGYRHELGMRGYAWYQKNWTTEAYMQGYFAVIDEIAAKRS
jgi:glycosyltransferase involved in cell wall biosynthesis